MGWFRESYYLKTKAWTCWDIYLGMWCPPVVSSTRRKWKWQISRVKTIHSAGTVSESQDHKTWDIHLSFQLIHLLLHDSNPQITQKSIIGHGLASPERTPCGVILTKWNKKQLTSKEDSWMSFKKPGKLFLKAALRNYKKICVREFRQWRIKVFIPNCYTHFTLSF